MIGLVQFLPLFALTLVAGETADRHDRRRILVICYLAQLLISAGLAFRSGARGRLVADLCPGRVCSAVPGRSSNRRRALLGPTLVPLQLLPRAIATNSLAAQLGIMLGPALGGLLCVVSPVLGYAVSAGLYAAAGVLCPVDSR